MSEYFITRNTLNKCPHICLYLTVKKHRVCKKRGSAIAWTAEQPGQGLSRKLSRRFARKISRGSPRTEDAYYTHRAFPCKDFAEKNQVFLAAFTTCGIWGESVPAPPIIGRQSGTQVAQSWGENTPQTGYRTEVPMRPIISRY